MAIIVRRNRNQQEGRRVTQYTMPIELQRGTAQEQLDNAFEPYPYDGYHKFTPSSYLTGAVGSPYSSQSRKDGSRVSCGLDWYSRLIQRHEMLLRVTGESVDVLRRKWTGERCPDHDNIRGQTRSRCPVCYGTNFVGGYVKYINAREPNGRTFIRLGPTEEDLELQETGMWQKFIPSCWTLPTPTLRDRDIVITYDPDTGEETWRYEILAVTRNRGFFGKFTQQTFTMQRLDRTDPVYKVDVLDLMDDGPGVLQGDDTILQDQVEEAYGDTYNDRGYSNGYQAGYTEGFHDGLNNREYHDVADFDMDGMLDNIYSQWRADAYGVENFQAGFREGYEDGYKDGSGTRESYGYAPSVNK